MSPLPKPADVVLETERLRLRRMRPDDVDALYLVFGDPIAMQYFPTRWTRDTLIAAIERNLKRYEDDGFGIWMVVLKETGEVIGDCGLALQPLPTGPEIEVGYHFQRAHWGHGYATEAARGCLRYGFETLGANRLISLIRPENVPSRRVAERNGLHVTAELIWSGLPHLVYAITREQWTS